MRSLRKLLIEKADTDSREFGQLEKKREALFRLRSNVPGFLLTPENIHRFMYRMKTIIEYLMVWIGPACWACNGQGVCFI